MIDLHLLLLQRHHHRPALRLEERPQFPEDLHLRFQEIEQGAIAIRVLYMARIQDRLWSQQHLSLAASLLAACPNSRSEVE
jgi:hypothetical protein